MNAFRRFRIGTLQDGRDEWLEFWKENHLLAPFEELRCRAERGPYGGREVKFIGLEDLIEKRSDDSIQALFIDVALEVALDFSDAI
jgi:hypothetical protein